MIFCIIGIVLGYVVYYMCDFASDPRHKRFMRAMDHAEIVFGSTEKAVQWMKHENTALGGSRPIDMMDSDENVEKVLEILGRIDFGIFS